ncbi:IBR finger domain-containing protein [Colletotrichum higginsianum]|uniref:RBR-type E3 ubiquitin transferase n=1 Tax=Colletotrichum higginsianum (strain IMI 349063) TaxID=759273 RepID=H1V735_COLHI|nr:IBR finger domain-containing protein [Colletotrichum higginsianum IMI 349063]OBR08102.1 IBR finger domain-containing protein [Colletotrichum higginsianum IMI 349063]CCF36037.1 IBR finger domain-containing protein [Colletotrichum higginsianum]
MLCGDVDDETLHLVLQVQLEDLESVKRSSKGKNRQDEISDAELAAEAYESELKSHILLISDRSMCKSMAKANQLDGRLVSILVNQEKQAAQDREVALRLSRGGKLNEDYSTDAIQGGLSTDVDEKLLSKLRSLYVSTDGYDDILDQAESSKWAASRGQTTEAAKAVKREKRQCNSCLSNYIATDLARCPCSHEYCRDCLQTLFETSLTDESLYPPRCCGRPIPVNDNREFLSSKLIGEFQAKAEELSTPNRTYCHRPTCSTFIPKEFIKADTAVCQRCRHRTCVMCKGAEHKDQDCAQDTLTQDLLRIAAANGWQRCFSCRRIVELEHGCNHMTCRCGAQFCYVCGNRWKTCNCAQWNEERLYARANAIVNRNANAHFNNPEVRTRQVEREAHNLVMNHQCAHNTWRSRGGAHRCEECHDSLPLYIYECARCRIRACRRCRFNRL